MNTMLRDVPEPDPREERLPRWAQDLLRQTRMAAQDRVEALAVLNGRASAEHAVLDPIGACVGLGERPVVEFRMPSGLSFEVKADPHHADSIRVRTDDSGRPGPGRAARIVAGSAINVVRIEG